MMFNTNETNEVSLRKVFLGPIILTMVVTIATWIFCADPIYSITPAYVANTSLGCLAFMASLTSIVFVTLAGGKAQLFGDTYFNGYYFAAIPTGMCLGMLLFGVFY
jgi:hypothetical protein